MAWLADKALMPMIAGVLIWTAAALLLNSVAIGSIWSVGLAVFLIGGGGELATPLQARLKEVADDAQPLAAALNHGAFNTAKALGSWLAGLAIGAGFGWRSTG